MTERTRFEELQALHDSIEDPKERRQWLNRHRAEWNRAHEEHQAQAIVVLAKRIPQKPETKPETRKAKKARSRKAMVERRKHVSRDPQSIPPEWILDGSWAGLSTPAKKVLPVLFALLDPEGKAVRMSYQTIGRLARLKPRTVGKAVREANDGGWIRWTIHRARCGGSWASINWLAPPRVGKRVPRR